MAPIRAKWILGGLVMLMTVCATPDATARSRGKHRRVLRRPATPAVVAVDSAVRCSCTSRSECPTIGTLAIRGHAKTPLYCNQLHGSENPGVTGGGNWYYQCVELANRWVESLGAPRIDGNANQLCSNADRRAYDVHRRGTAYEPVPGDLLVWDGGSMGHVGVVTEVSASKMVFANQNYGSGGVQYPVLSVSRTKDSFGTPRNSRLTAKCVIHPKALGR